MATLTAATIARREARKAVKAHYASKGIRLEESQARFIWSVGLTTEEFLAVRTAFALGEPHKPVVTARRARKAVASTVQVRVAISDDYRSHLSTDYATDSVWINPKGEMFKVNFAGHEGFATKVAAAGVIKGKQFGAYVPTLEDAGWLHISGATIINTVALTAEQQDTLLQWGKATTVHTDAVQRFFKSGGYYR